jgi:hypothetical protein
MKGKEYIKWFTEEEKVKWLNNFHQQDLQTDLGVYMEREFPQYHVFFFLGFDIRKSNEGESFWVNIFHQYKKFDNIKIKPGFSFKSVCKQPKVF